MFHVVFALDGRPNVVVLLVPNKHFQTISCCEAFDLPCSMLPRALRQVACHAKIKRSVWFICLNVNPTASHADILEDVDGRDKPGHDR
jgi:hypothetical protein